MRSSGVVLGMCALGLLMGCPEETTVDAGSAVDGGGGADVDPGDGSGRDATTGLDAVAGDRGATDLAQPDTFVLACPSDDVYEPNDSAGEAFALPHPGPVTDTISCDGEDWYAITVPANFGLGVRLEFSSADADLDLAYYLASDPGTALDSAAGSGNLETVFGEYFAEATPVLIQVVNHDSPATASYRLVITFYLDGTCASDTAAEPNDTAETAAALTPPVDALALHACDEHDWYALTVPADHGLSVDLHHSPAQANLDLGLYLASDTSAPLVERTQYAPNKQVTHELFASATEVRVLVRNASFPGPRTDYTLDVATHPGGYCLDDGHEPNDASAAATDLDSGLLGGVLCRDNVDWFQFTVAEPGPESRIVINHGGFDLAFALSAQGGGALGTATTEDGTTTISFTSAASTVYLLQVSKAAGETAVAARYNVQAIHGSPPANDRCTDAIAISPGNQVAGDTSHGHDDVSFAAATSSCAGSDSDGPDVFYSVQVPAGQQLTATLVSREDLLLHLVDGCDTRCCYAGVDAEPGDPLNDVTETLTWTNSTGSAQELYLGVDSKSWLREGPFTLEVSLGGGGTPDGGSGACTPDEAADGGVREDAG